MLRTKTGNLLLLTALLVFSGFSEEVTVEPSSKEVGTEDTLSVSINISSEKQIGTDSEQPTLNTKDFTLLPGQSSSTYIQSVNGNVTFARSYVFYLKPTKTGQGIVEVLYKGETYRTQVKVVKGSLAPPATQSNTPDPFANPFGGSFFSSVDPDVDPDVDPKVYEPKFRYVLKKKSYYVNEPIVVNDYLLAHPDASISDVFYRDTFISQQAHITNVYNPSEGGIEKIDGVDYIKSYFGSHLIIPLQTPMKITPPSFGMHFGSPIYFGRKEIGVVATGPDFNILPLPKTPENFQEIFVKTLSIDASPPLEDLKVGSTFIYTVTLNAVGNLRSMTTPTLAIANAEVSSLQKPIVETIVDDELNVTKVIEYYITPKEVGGIDIPSITLSYFNYDSGKYQTLNIPSHHANVVSNDVSDTVSKSKTEAEENNTPKEVFRNKPSKSISFITYLSVPLFFSGVFFLLSAIGFLSNLRTKRKQQQDGRLLVQVKRLLNNKDTLLNATNYYLQTLAKIHKIPVHSLEGILLELMVRFPELSNELNALIVLVKNLEEERFRPPSSLKNNDLKQDEMKQILLNNIDKLQKHGGIHV